VLLLLACFLAFHDYILILIDFFDFWGVYLTIAPTARWMVGGVLFFGSKFMPAHVVRIEVSEMALHSHMAPCSARFQRVSPPS
jgi:hypothetical protein